MRGVKFFLVVAAIAALSGCDDTLTPVMREEIRIAQLIDRTLTVLPSLNGTVTPSGERAIKDGEPLNLIASPGNGYTFQRWEKLAGDGTVTFDDALNPATTVRLTDGNAVIQAVISDVQWQLTVTADAHGSASPSGTRNVWNGVPLQLHTEPYATYKFLNWTRTAGAGSVSFSNSTDPNATVTLTGGNATIQANFTKAAVTLQEVGSRQFDNNTTFPNEAVDIHFSAGYLYVYGRRSDYDSVIRRFNVVNPAAPSTSGYDYRYIYGEAAALEGDDTYLFAMENDDTTEPHAVLRMPIASFGPSVSISTYATTGNARDLSIQSEGDLYVWAGTPTKVFGLVKSSFAETYYGAPETDTEFGSIKRTPWGFFAIQDDNGAGELCGFDVDAMSGATPTANYTITAYGGGDMDPGWAGRIATQVDKELIAIPMYDPDNDPEDCVKIFTSDSPSVSWVGTAGLPGRSKQIHYDEAYIFVAGYSGTSAYIYVIDASVPSEAQVMMSHQIIGFEWVDAVYLNGTTLYAIVDSTAAAKPTLKIYNVVEQ